MRWINVLSFLVAFRFHLIACPPDNVYNACIWADTSVCPYDINLCRWYCKDLCKCCIATFTKGALVKTKAPFFVVYRPKRAKRALRAKRKLSCRQSGATRDLKTWKRLYPRCCHPERSEGSIIGSSWAGGPCPYGGGMVACLWADTPVALYNI